MNCLVEKSVNFNDGDLTSDAGLPLYREFDEKIGFSEAIKDILRVKDKANLEFILIHILLFKIYQNISGYHTNDNAGVLTTDTVFKSVLSKGVLVFQSTISRFNSRLDVDNAKQLQFINNKILVSQDHS